MIQFELLKEEVVLLQNYAKTSKIGLIRNKAHSVLLRSKGVKIKDIAFGLGVSFRTVERWICDFKKRRIASMFSGLVGNENASKLTRIQKEEIKKVLSTPPSWYGLPKEFWDVPQLKKYLYARFGQVYESDRSYHFLLEFGNLSFKVLDKFSIKRNEVQIGERMEEIYKELVPLMIDPTWEVFCSDETRIVLEAITRRAWIKKGEKTVLKVERTDDYQNYLGFLNQKTFKCHVFELAWGNQEGIIKTTTEFLKLYPKKKICIIWDNATCHKGNLIREALKTGGPLQRVHLITFPPYAPDYNPIERLWQYTKNKLSNKQNTTFQETKHKFMQLTNNQFFPFEI